MMEKATIKKNIEIFDFDGTFYHSPVPERLENAIDFAMSKLVLDKGKNLKDFKGQLAREIRSAGMRNITESMISNFVETMVSFDENGDTDLYTFMTKMSMVKTILQL